MPAQPAKQFARSPRRADRRKPLNRSQRDGRAVRAMRRTFSEPAVKCRRKFLRYYPGGFVDLEYLGLERDYKWKAHENWQSGLDKGQFESLLRAQNFAEIAGRAIAVEARTNLLFSFEKMALRDAIKVRVGAKSFAEGLFEFLHSNAPLQDRFSRWCDVVAGLPRRQTRVLTWPIATVFGFLAQPRMHFFFKPMVTRKAAERYGYDLKYTSTPRWETYSGILRFARRVREDLRDLKPRDMIDLQSFLWVQGSDEYSD